MNPAEELNQTLKGSVIDKLLSDFGRSLFFPKGIVFQATQAGREAHRFNATAGIAYSKKQPMILPSVAGQIPGLTPEESVSYSPTSGTSVIRSLWKDQLCRKNPGLKDKRFTDPVVVPGLTAGIFLTADLFANPGDTVFLPDLYWGNYRLIFETRKGAEIITYPLFSSKGKLAVKELAETLESKARNNKAVLILNFPNNPTGYSPKREEAHALREALKDLAKKGLSLAVICDDAYFGLFYEEDLFKESVFSLLADADKNLLAVKIDGSTKEDFTWGFRTGFITFGNPALGKPQEEVLLEKLSGAIRSSFSSSSRLAQEILAKAFSSREYWEEKENLQTQLRDRYRKVKSILSDLPKESPLLPLPFNSGYFLSLECRGIDAEVLRRKLLREEGIGVIALGESYIRIAYSAVEEGDLEELFKRLISCAESLITPPKAGQDA